MRKAAVLFLTLIILGIGGYSGWYCYQKQYGDLPERHVENNFSFGSVVDKAKNLAAEPYVSPETDLPAELKKLSYDDCRDIRFIRENGPWYNQNLPYEIQFFHLGGIYNISVPLNEVENNVSRSINYSGSYFDYGKNKLPKDEFSSLGYAGFRIHSPLNTSAYFDELVTFLGASYFRGLAKGQKYGLSARGLAIDTAELTGEEFPVFKEFWIEKPKPKDKFIRLYALLDSKSVSGAYDFKIIPGTNTIMEITAHLFARQDIKKLGVAPLTSMFLFGENNKNQFDDYRPEVHDSDGLLIHNGHDEWLWRPLDNSEHLRISSFVDDNLKGFGLQQRDRNIADYLDFEAHYQERPSVWVEPLEDWGEGMVQLVEIPSRQEIHDNIVAYWVPRQPLLAGQERIFRYRLIWLNEVIKDKPMAEIAATRTGKGGISGADENSGERKFVIDFSGKEISHENSVKNIIPDVSAMNGKITNVSSIYNPLIKGITVYVDYLPVGENDELRISLRQNNKTVSEIWSYQWLK